MITGSKKGKKKKKGAAVVDWGALEEAEEDAAAAEAPAEAPPEPVNATSPAAGRCPKEDESRRPISSCH